MDDALRSRVRTWAAYHKVDEGLAMLQLIRFALDFFEAHNESAALTAEARRDRWLGVPERKGIPTPKPVPPTPRDRTPAGAGPWRAYLRPAELRIVRIMQTKPGVVWSPHMIRSHEWWEDAAHRSHLYVSLINLQDFRAVTKLSYSSYKLEPDRAAAMVANTPSDGAVVARRRVRRTAAVGVGSSHRENVS